MDETSIQVYEFKVEEHLTDEQLEAYKNLRANVGEETLKGIDDLKILKFLIARNYDVASATEMLNRHLQYWKKLGISTLLDSFGDNTKLKADYFSTAVLGFDNDGCIVRILRVGVSDIRGLAMSFTKVEAIMFAANLLQQDKTTQKERFKKTGEGGEDKQTYIIDLLGLRWRVIFCRPLTHLFTVILRLYEGNYPESLKCAYIVNAPSFFGLIYKFVKSILPSEILGKVHILTAEECTGVLTNAIPEDILPKFLGGNKTGEHEDEFCSSLFMYPPDTPVPEKYYISGTLEKDPDAKKVTILPGETFSVKFEIKNVPSLLLWDFQTKINDIAMGLVFQKDDTKEVEWILPSKRFNSHSFLESGRMNCSKTGTYEMIFDNSYSWWAQKELTYKTAVCESDIPEDISKNLML